MGSKSVRGTSKSLQVLLLFQQTVKGFAQKQLGNTQILSAESETAVGEVATVWLCIVSMK